MATVATAGTLAGVGGGVMPTVATCDPAARSKLLSAYQIAGAWLRTAAAWLRRALGSSSARDAWERGALRRAFGPYSPMRARQVLRVIRGVLDRFERGFSHGDQRRPPVLACLPASYRRCRTGLLGNASIYGTLRFCPRLLSRDVTGVAKVVLHEMMHQGLGVGDQRHADCDGSRHRCYRDGARALVAAGRYDLALRNIDNYVALVAHFGAARATSPGARRSETPPRRSSQDG